ncbi:MAG: hypothetical protein KAW93_10955 [Methanogenium sp.]|nr:hypothetical protein [Methanogenium sp.]
MRGFVKCISDNETLVAVDQNIRRIYGEFLNLDKVDELAPGLMAPALRQRYK